MRGKSSATRSRDLWVAKRAYSSTPEQLAFYAKPKLLIVDEVGYLPFEKRSAHLYFQLVVRRYERGSVLIRSMGGHHHSTRAAPPRTSPSAAPFAES